MSQSARLSLIVVCSFLLASHDAQARIETIEVNQAIGVQKNNALKFVAGKDTVIRAFLSSPATINESQTGAKIIRDGRDVTTLSPNAYDTPTVIVDFQCPNRAACGDWAAGNYTFEVTVNGEAKSTAGSSYTFLERGMLRVLAVPVKANYAGTIVPVTDNRWKTFANYVRATYPIAADKLVWEIRSEFDASDSSFDLETDDGQRNLWEALAKLIPAHCAATPSIDGCYHQVFGFIMDRPNPYPNGRLQGFTYGKPANIGVIRDEDAAATVAHEIGHTFGLGDSYDGGSFHCSVNPTPDEFEGKDWDDRDKTVKCMTGRTALEGVSGTKIPAAHHPYDVGGRGPLADMAEYMGSGGKQEQFWTTQEAYDWLFDKFVPEDPPNALRVGTSAVPQRYIQCFGLIRENASSSSDVLMDPCWTFTADAGEIPNTTGRYMMAAVDAGGVRVATTQIQLEFDPVGPKGLPPRQVALAPFGEEMSFPSGTVKLQIIRDGNVLREIPISANAPVVTNVASQLTGVQNSEVTITWIATDADGDPLSFEVEFNPDVTNASSEWETLIRDVTDRDLTIDFGGMPGGPHAKIRVVASDGINSGEGQSIEFLVPAKAPEAYIEELPTASYEVGEEITFDAEILDLQDDEIDETKIQWTSSISGPLGFGAPLTVGELPQGVHTITVTATNSNGLKGSDSVMVFVGTPVRRRGVRR